MRRIAPIAVALAACTLVAGPALAGGDPNRISATGDEVSQSEMTLVLSAPKIDPGRAIIQFINSGEDPHDLQIRRKGAENVKKQTGIVDGGDQEEIELRLRKKKRYELWCGLADHRELGMEAELRVRKR